MKKSRKMGLLPFSRLQVFLMGGKRPRDEDIRLLVAYHELAIQCVGLHPQSDQWYIKKHAMEQLSTQLHGTTYDYSAVVHPPHKEVPHIEKLLKVYIKSITKKKWKYTFFHWFRNDYPQHVYDSMPETKEFIEWYKAKRAKAKRKK